jgi:hypothetical protein
MNRPEITKLEKSADSQTPYLSRYNKLTNQQFDPENDGTASGDDRVTGGRIGIPSQKPIMSVPGNDGSANGGRIGIPSKKPIMSVPEMSVPEMSIPVPVPYQLLDRKLRSNYKFNILDLSGKELIINIINTWQDILSDLTRQEYNNILTKNNRLSYIGMTLIILTVLFAVLYAFIF